MKKIEWTLDEDTDTGNFYVSKNVDVGDVMVVIIKLAKQFKISLPMLFTKAPELRRLK